MCSLVCICKIVFFCETLSVAREAGKGVYSGFYNENSKMARHAVDFEARPKKSVQNQTETEMKRETKSTIFIWNSQRSQGYIDPLPCV